MTKFPHFDYIIIGNGLAGLQLALKMASDEYFKNKTIALIDPSTKNSNDKTWSFWDTSHSKWHNISYKTWSNAKIYTSRKAISLQLAPYQYFSIRSIDFYTNAKLELGKHKNFHFIIDRVTSVTEGKVVKVTTTNITYSCKHVFDSRLPLDFYNHNNSINITQHFKGIVIKTDTNVFDIDTLVMMDYRLKDGNKTSFMYVLPFAKNKALIEFTYFTKNLVEEHVYDTYIATYIKNYLNIETYDILESEKGKIPMTTFPFNSYNTPNMTKIGTAGGWVKPSTGYAFKHSENKATQIITNIKANKIPSYKLFKKRYKFYDKIFLKVLQDENDKGEWIFQQFYNKNNAKTMFRFLDEKSTLLEEFKIMKSLFSWTFIKAFFKTL
ncbi:lycopene cyclase family protein [Postechiella marina]|uniref:Lycopene cyclase family protein n=1 Tax=Postechiella marina TaxID=943941 RepID=A0ABP8C9H9_9FLAO